MTKDFMPYYHCGRCGHLWRGRNEMTTCSMCGSYLVQKGKIEKQIRTYRCYNCGHDQCEYCVIRGEICKQCGRW